MNTVDQDMYRIGSTSFRNLFRTVREILNEYQELIESLERVNKQLEKENDALLERLSKYAVKHLKDAEEKDITIEEYDNKTRIILDTNYLFWRV